METTDAVAALAALAQDNRLDVFRLLVQAGRDGISAGAVAETLDLAPNTLTFHFDRLRTAGLATVRREGRSMIYAARFETGDELQEVYARLRQAGGNVIEQGQTTCCYATSEKSWIDDPAGIAWETFHTKGESTDYGDGSGENGARVAHEKQEKQPACC